MTQFNESGLFHCLMWLCVRAVKSKNDGESDTCDVTKGGENLNADSLNRTFVPS